MRIDRPTQAVVTVAFALALVGCDSTQPSRIETRRASLSMSATAIVDIVNCYEIWLDTSDPPDGIPDTFFSTFCEPLAEPFNDQRTVAWRYSAMVSVVRAGSTTEEIIGSSVQPQDGIDDFISLTEYDSIVGVAPPKPPEDIIYFRFPKQVSMGSSVYASLGTPNVLGVPAPGTFDFDVDTGDTIVVRMRKQSWTAGLPPGTTSEQFRNIQVSAQLAIGGVPVAVTGSPTTSNEDQAGVTFSFTVR